MTFRKSASVAAFALLALAVLPAGLRAQAPPPPGPATVDGLISALYSCFTCGPGAPPRMDLYRTLVHPKACLVRMLKDGPVIMDLDQFVASFLERYRTGQIRTFVEEEVSRRTERFGTIVQVWSVYRKGLNTTNPAEYVRGINGFQLIHDGTRWWISGAIWQDERPDAKIPDDDLR